MASEAYIENSQSIASATGEYGSASATGEYGSASATGERGSASATGDSGAASATGKFGSASATGWAGSASTTGYRGSAAATGMRGSASATGWAGSASATGKWGVAIASYATHESVVEAGPGGVAVAIGEAVQWKVHRGAILIQRWDGGFAVLNGSDYAHLHGQFVLVVRGQIQEAGS